MHVVFSKRFEVCLLKGVHDLDISLGGSDVQGRFPCRVSNLDVNGLFLEKCLDDGEMSVC